MLIQQMKSTPSIQIEVDNIHLPSGQLDDSSLIDTPSITVANYDHYNKIIPHNTSSIESMNTVPCIWLIPLLFITGTASLLLETPIMVQIDNHPISIHKSLLLPTLTSIGRRRDCNQQLLDQFFFSFHVFFNLPHATRLDWGSVA